MFRHTPFQSNLLDYVDFTEFHTLLVSVRVDWMWSVSSILIHLFDFYLNVLIFIKTWIIISCLPDRLYGLVVTVPDYKFKGPGSDSRRYKIFWEVVGLEQGPLSLVSTIEELLGRNSSGFGL
jgi:hypothetical protein